VLPLLLAVLPEEVGGLALATVLLVFGVVAVGGLVKGLAGFGYAVASTAVLATLLSPTVAVTVMIVPTMAANLALVRELDHEELSTCARRFGPFVLAAGLGTLVGMALLERVPARPLAVGLGAFTLVYVVLKQDRVTVPGETWLRDRCLVRGRAAEVGVGLVSGLVFGGTNVGVQVVAYLDALDLDRSTFVGVLSMVLVGLSVVRVGAAAGLGLYEGGGLLAVSLVAAVPGLVGVAAGERLRRRLPPAAVETAVLVLLAVIAARLLSRGLGI